MNQTIAGLLYWRAGQASAGRPQLPHRAATSETRWPPDLRRWPAASATGAPPPPPLPRTTTATTTTSTRLRRRRPRSSSPSRRCRTPPRPRAPTTTAAAGEAGARGAARARRRSRGRLASSPTRGRPTPTRSSRCVRACRFRATLLAVTAAGARLFVRVHWSMGRKDLVIRVHCSYL